ncbi:DUF6945 domain-containing protein [Klebsiella michiganensis]|uniref:DUF6945 domain-containing protein n=1 Tax=Klebsiella michiganensis TaxID=1134687 RepID=UPI001CC9C671|nr:hypothetical protein [Klebsiella michiganensis]MBZ7303625.1 hypothetical protein [Klebsiella michiganensis]MDU1151977.1 hypothetical protein [Klebsiella michiganensis]MDU1208004.1 hypothetical protein [Klebsiella michiganensis]HEJ7577113.1 hypothetical protein [Klebsiella michiganensis]
MAVVKTKRTPPPDEPYTNIEMRLICASKIKIVNGEHAGTVINWDSDMLRVYLYLFNQVKGFENNSGEFYQSQDKIRLSTGIGKTKLNEVLGVLKKLGLIQPTGKKAVKGAPRGLVKYTASRLMDVIGNLEIIFADDDGEPVWDHDRASGKKKSKKSEEIKRDGKSDDGVIPQAEQAAATATPSADEPANQPTDTPADQNVGLASEPAPDDSGQRDSVASDDDGSSDDRAAGNHEMSQQRPFPWQGDTFIKNRLSENAYQWALTAGATDWHHACRLVWEKIELTPPTEIDECYKPLSLC